MNNTKLTRLTVVLLGTAGIALLPWIVVLATTLRDSAGWVLLDVLEAACLLGTAHLLRGGSDHHRTTAALAALLLTADAWLDLSTAAPGDDLTVALAMALFAELPLAGLCTVLVLRARTATPVAEAAAVVVAVRPVHVVGQRVVGQRVVSRRVVSPAVRRPAARPAPARPAARRHPVARRSSRSRVSSSAGL